MLVSGSNVRAVCAVCGSVFVDECNVMSCTMFHSLLSSVNKARKPWAAQRP